MSLSVAVAGASGYAGGELLRLIAGHPEFEVTIVTAHQNAGQPLASVHPHLRSLAHLELQPTTAEVLAGADIVFLALPHGKSGEVTAGLPDDVVAIDCGADHRLAAAADWEAFYDGPYTGAWTYGLPELVLAREDEDGQSLAGGPGSSANCSSARPASRCPAATSPRSPSASRPASRRA
jgi:N-acetyl-gamma-glutamyl-phosphate reductase